MEAQRRDVVLITFQHSSQDLSIPYVMHNPRRSSFLRDLLSFQSIKAFPYVPSLCIFSIALTASPSVRRRPLLPLTCAAPRSLYSLRLFDGIHLAFEFASIVIVLYHNALRLLRRCARGTPVVRPGLRVSGCSRRELSCCHRPSNYHGLDRKMSDQQLSDIYQ